MTVEIAQVMRKYGINCRHNESLNFLQDLIAREYLDKWEGKEFQTEIGAYDYWEPFHKELGIHRDV